MRTITEVEGPLHINGSVPSGMPVSWKPIFEALARGLERAGRDKTTGELTLRLVLQSGGVRDKYLAVSSKIEEK